MPNVPVSPAKRNSLKEIFTASKPIVGMVHLQPLPGSPAYHGEKVDRIVEAALRDAAALKDGGVDGVMVENMLDLPFAKASDIGFETVACMVAAAREVKKATSLPLGVNCLANGVVQAMAVAIATGADWVRANEWANAYIADEGYTEAAAPRALRYRSFLRAEHVKVFADVDVKHGSHYIIADRSIEEQAMDAEFFGADALIVTGSRTGVEPPLQRVRRVKRISHLPVLIGSGLDEQNVGRLFRFADGAIVGTSLKKEGKWWNPVDASRVRRLMKAVSAFR